MWVANKYIKKPVGDSGQPQIPSLVIPRPNSATDKITTNEEKAEVIASSFLLPKPPTPATLPPANYPMPKEPSMPITTEQVKKNIARLSPYKALGLDGIPNIVFQMNADMLALG